MVGIESDIVMIAEMLVQEEVEVHKEFVGTKTGKIRQSSFVDDVHQVG